MGKKKSLNIFRFFKPFSIRQKILMLFYQSLVLLSCLCYWRTLEGGEVEYLKEQTGFFLFLMLLSMALTIIALIGIYYSFHFRLQVLNWLIEIALIAFTVTRDLGTDLEHHGQFNLMAYFLLWLPLILGFVGLKVANQIKQLMQNDKVFWGIFIGISVVGVLYVYIGMIFSYEQWHFGLRNVRLKNQWPHCNLYPPGSPWVALLPDRALNFFTGPSSCPNVHKFSQLKDTVLTVDCPEPVTVIENPDYISFRTDMFVLLETGLEKWVNKTKAFEKEYTIPGDAKVTIKAEYFSVKCQGLENYHIQNVVQEEVIERLEETSKKRTEKPMNLIVFMMDTVSRAQVYRKMDSLVAFLETLEGSEVFQFMRILSNGFNTEYNTRAMYTGSQLRQERMGRPYWDLLRGQGNAALYINGFCEDWMSTFVKTPFAGMDRSVFLPFCHPEYHPYEKTFGNFAGPFSITRRCINGKYVHNHIFDYIREFWKNYKDFGKVIHVPLQEGHEGTGEVILTMQEDFTSFLQELVSTGEMERTVVVITSDHGSHMGPYFMSGPMGVFEQKLPVLYMLYPKWFLDKYKFREMLLDNEQRLVSHYDTHWTFRHLASLPEFGGEIVENRMKNYTHLWDCKHNARFIETAAKYYHNVWKKNWKEEIVTQIYEKIDNCLEQLESSVELETDPDVRVLDSENSELPTVDDVLHDLDVKYWFEDAYQDISKSDLIDHAFPDVGPSAINTDWELEKHTWQTFKAPGSGRYLFGRSLLKYADDRNMKHAGIINGPCSQREDNDFLAIG